MLLFILFGILLIANQIPLPLSTAAVEVLVSNGRFFKCPTQLATPTLLESFSGGKLLIEPSSDEEDLYIPIDRSYDGNDWHRVQGRYVSHVTTTCGEIELDYYFHLCEIEVPKLEDKNVGYFLTRWEEKNVTDRRVAARFLERATWGATWDEIVEFESQIATLGTKALALWVKSQQSMRPS
jgi:hypothetical protein